MDALTRKQIALMPAGLELDLCIAEQIMGYKWVYTNADVPWMRPGVSELKPPNWYQNGDTLLPWHTMEGVEILHGKGQSQNVDSGAFGRYSTDLVAAKQVQSTLFRQEWDFVIWQSHLLRRPAFQVEIMKDAALPTEKRHFVDADSEELAICRAALLARLL